MKLLLLSIALLITLVIAGIGISYSSRVDPMVVELPKVPGNSTTVITPSPPAIPLFEPPPAIDSSPVQKADEVRKEAIHPLETTEDWTHRYANSTLKILREDRQSALDRFSELSQPEFEKRFASGQFEVLAKDSTYSNTSTDPLELSLVIIQSKARGGEVRKTVLPPEDYPELRNLKEKIVWLDSQIRKQSN